ncbi:MAG: hypothetical protein Q9167_007693 [Letrouitia subvulpina]
MAAHVLSSMWFLKPDSIYDTEKVYELKFDPPNRFPRTNMKIERQDSIEIEDIRGRQTDFSFARNGFEIINIDVDLSPEDFDDKELVVDHYLPKVAHTVKAKLAAARVQVLDYLIRKRHPHISVDDETATPNV